MLFKVNHTTLTTTSESNCLSKLRQSSVVHNEVVSIPSDGSTSVSLPSCTDLPLYDRLRSLVSNSGTTNSPSMFKLSNELVRRETSGGFIGEVLVVFCFLRFSCFWMLGLSCNVCLIVCSLLLLDKPLPSKESNMVTLSPGFITALLIACGLDNSQVFIARQ